MDRVQRRNNRCTHSKENACCLCTLHSMDVFICCSTLYVTKRTKCPGSRRSIGTKHTHTHRRRHHYVNRVCVRVSNWTNKHEMFTQEEFVSVFDHCCSCLLILTSHAPWFSPVLHHATTPAPAPPASLIFSLSLFLLWEHTDQ